MIYEHFNVVGDLLPYEGNFNGQVMTVSVIQISTQLTLGHVQEVLQKRSGFKTAAVWHTSQKPGMVSLCSTTEHVSERDINDLLQDIDILLKQQKRIRERQMARSTRSTNYLNDPRHKRRRY